MPIWDRDLQIKKWDPRILLHSGRNSLLAWLGVGPTQLTLNDKAFSNVKTVKYTIGAYGVTGCDFNFPNDANQTENVKDLGHAVPAFARILDVKTVTEVAFTPDPTTLVMEIGTSSSGHELVGSATIKSANAITAMAADHAFTVAPADAASHVYCAATPGANWSTITAGKVAVYISYIEI